jgi:hypothetical protein
MKKIYITIFLALFVFNHAVARISKGYIVEIVKKIKHPNGITTAEYFNYFIDSSVNNSSLKQILYSNLDTINDKVLLIKVLNSFTYLEKDNLFVGKYADFKKIQNNRVYRISNNKNNISIKIVKGEFEFEIREESLELFSKEFINISHINMSIPYNDNKEVRTVAYLISYQNLEILNDKEIKWFGIK